MWAARGMMVASLVALAGAAALRSSPPRSAAKIAGHTAANQSQAPAAAQEVASLRAKLGKMAVALSAMLDPKGPLAHSQVASSTAAFVGRLEAVVKETQGMNDTKAALKKLRDAQAGVRSLAAGMTAKQEQLAQEGSSQEESLLLGVLMTRQHDPMERQLEVLQSDEFRSLPAVVAVLAANNTKTPLFQQVAGYLDAHKGAAAASAPASVVSPEASLIPAKLSVGKDGKPDVGPIVGALQTQLKHMEDNERRMATLHGSVMKQLEAAVAKEKKKNPRAARQVQLMERAERRKYAKEVAVVKSDARNMKAAIDAVRRGDVQALAKSQAALTASMKLVQARSGGFIYLLQLAHRTQGLDCPYCAAQCVDKCHTAGRPYVACLTECADAGK